jgi:hypothetical protein
MIKKALLAGTLAAGLIVPAQAKAGLILPPKPAIIKPENLEFSKHMLAMPLTMGMMLRKDSAAAIQFVGGATIAIGGNPSGTSTIALNSGLTGGIASSVSNGDFVVAVFATGSTADRSLSITDGSNAYTLIGSELYSDDNLDTNLRVAYKFVSGDTATTFGATGFGDDAGAAAVYVFRGVNPTTPIDVTTTTATGINSGRPNPPSITPVTPGAFVVAVGASGHNTTYTFTSSLTAFRTVVSPDFYNCTLGIGHVDNWTSGPVDPAQFVLSGGSDSANFSWAALTFALRPA